MAEVAEQIPEWVTRFDDEVRRLYLRAPRKMLEQQRLLYAQLVNGVENHLRGRIRAWTVPLYGAALFLIMTVIAAVVIAVVCVLLQWLPAWIVDPPLWILAALLTWGMVAIRKQNAGLIDAWNTNGLTYGRLQQVLSQNFLASIGLGTLFGMQIGLVSYTRTHLGISDEAAKRSFSLCFDNFLQAICSDVFELYTGPGFNHNFWSATSFFIFRTAYTALFVYGVYLVAMKFKARRCFAGFPGQDPAYPAVIDWLRGLSRAENSWLLDHFDEYLFLRISAEYLAGNFGAVRRLSASFPRLRVNEETRRLFVDEAGEPLFEGYSPR